MAMMPIADGFSEQAPMSDINVTPLVDVMLVLLIIFMVTAPLLTHAVRVDLPRAAAAPHADKPSVVTLSLDAAGTLYWNDKALAEGELTDRLADAARRNPDTELQLRADRNTRYERIAGIMAAARAAGLLKLGFVTDPTVSNTHSASALDSGRKH
jgi:biopolymer transport protein ExbD